MKKISINILSEKSIRDAIAEIEAYKQQFIDKNREFVRKLSEAGIKVMYQNLYGYGDSEPPEPSDPHVMVGFSEGVMQATLRLRGEDVMFVEFGAGITYNGPARQSPNPKGMELGYTIGSYGLGQGAMEYWYYRGDDGQWHISYGTEATMPMYKAGMEIRQRYAEIAKSVFGG